MRSSFPESLVVADNFPFGLPNRFPSLFFLAQASLVREEILSAHLRRWTYPSLAHTVPVSRATRGKPDGYPIGERHMAEDISCDRRRFLGPAVILLHGWPYDIYS